MTMISDPTTFPRGDTINTNLQNMEPVSETDQEPVSEDLGKLTVVDKARTGRVSQPISSFDVLKWLQWNSHFSLNNLSI